MSTLGSSKNFKSLLESSSYQSPGGGSAFAPLRQNVIKTALAMGYDEATMIECGVNWADDHDPFRHVKNHQYAHWANACNFRVFQSWEAQLGEEKIGDLMGARNIGVLVKSYEVDLKSVVEFPDSLIVANHITKVFPDRYFSITTIWSLTQQKIVANVSGYAVFFDFDKGVPANLLKVGGVHADLYHALEARRVREAESAEEWEKKNPKKIRDKAKI